MFKLKNYIKKKYSHDSSTSSDTESSLGTNVAPKRASGVSGLEVKVGF